ncbi:BTAD domain-containing putative transcriptional regulator [Azohydromonas aeria]|uniref:BTAD domain-containing putative transcriptional regulator n=1 Tax=Azohydromonas aeria TaxID=2590212 RepID=UPI0012F71EF7|nr:BTAD domain-containing putative transcriptional regulator [Azohydromonas aeria]
MQNPSPVPVLAKLCRPQGDAPLPRPRLFARLDACATHRMAWVAGPPGAGKTLLVSSWLAARALRSLWLQLDADDAEPATFFHYLGLAVRQAGTDAALDWPVLTPAYLPGLAGFTRRCAQRLAAALPPPAVLVLDNHEQLPAEGALQGVLRELAQALPPGLCLLVLSRGEPPEALARLRVHGELAQLPAAELALSEDEAEALVRAQGGARAGEAPALARALRERTQGWLAGFSVLLSEACGSQGEAAPERSRELLAGYFSSEVLGRFGAPLQQALLRTALLPSMGADAAVCLGGDPAVAQALAELHRQNCFVLRRGAADQPVYEYHALFRGFLLERAAACFGAAEWARCRAAAAALLEEAGQSEAAAALYRDAGDAAALAALARREAPALLAAGRHRTLESWLGALPPDAFELDPWLGCARAAARLPFDPAAARALYAQAWAAFDARDDATGLYTAWAGVMESFFYEWRDFRGADGWIDAYDRLRARHPDFPSAAVELRTYLAMGTLLHRRPQHPLLPAWSRRALALLDSGARDAAVVLGGYLVIWTLWRGRTTEAQDIVARVEARAREGLMPLGAILWSCAVALLHSVRGELDACRARVAQAQAVARHNDLHAFDFLLAAQVARCAVIAGAPDEARQALADMARTVRDSPINTAFLRHLQSGAAALQGDAPRALALSEAALEQAVEGGVPFLEAHCHLDRARLRLSAGEADWTGSLTAARAICRDIGSPVLLNLCCELEAHAALARGNAAAARAALEQALGFSQAMHGATWLMAGPAASARLYDAALAQGLAVEHVRRLVRRRGLRPPEGAVAAEAWPWPVRVALLGRFELLLDGAPLRASGKPQHKPLELLQCLCAGGGRMDTARLGDALWPDAEGDAADQALRTTLHRLRKLLGVEAALHLEGGQLWLDGGLVWVDALAFEHEARQALAPASNSDVASLRRALGRYAGPLLPGVSAPWALAGRERLRATFLRLAERLVAALEAAGDWAGVAEACERVLALEPLAEAFHCRLMQAHAQQGRRAEALAAYRHCRALLLAQLGVSPAEATQSLYRRLAQE